MYVKIVKININNSNFTADIIIKMNRKENKNIN